jgi:carboxypeptidase T
MKSIILFAFLLFSAFLFAQQSQYSRVQFDLTKTSLAEISNLGIPVDHGEYKKGVFFITEVSAWGMEQIKLHTVPVEVVIDDIVKFHKEQNKLVPQKNGSCPEVTTPEIKVPSNFKYGSMASFYTYQEMLNELDSMKSKYPNLISSRTPISNFLTFENRPIFWVRMSDNPEQDEVVEKEVLYSSVHHAREPMSMTQTIFYMWYLLENYNQSEEVQHILNNSELYFVPCLNPDGYIYNQTTNPAGYGMHRKNRREVGTTNKGVDLNRNYSYQFGTTGVSTDPNSDVYPGAAAFSEAETQAMKWFCENHEFVTAFNAHSYGDLILFPIGATGAEFADDHDYFNNFTDHMVQYNSYTNQKGSALYPTSGSSDDYMYKEDLNVKPKIFAMTPEVGIGAQGFWPPLNAILPNAKNMLFPNLVLAHLPHQYLVTTDLDPARISVSATHFTHQVERLGLTSGTVTVGLEPLENIASVGADVSYNLNLEEISTSSIAFQVEPGTLEGDNLRYVLKTIYSTWTKRDTINKIYGGLDVQVFDDVELGNQWSGDWSIESHTSYSPNSAYSDSENSGNPVNYNNDVNAVLDLNNRVDLSNATAAMVSFRAKWDIEANYDAVQFLVSTNNKATWIPQCGKYTVVGTSANGSAQPEGEPVFEGTQSEWVLEEISLDDYIGQKVHFRFELMSDGGVGQDGFYFDDFTVSHNGSNLGLKARSTNRIMLYPNPSVDRLTIQMDEVRTVKELVILDMNGREVKRTLLNEAISKKAIEISDLENGIYTLLVKGEEGLIGRQRFVKSAN